MVHQENQVSNLDHNTFRLENRHPHIANTCHLPGVCRVFLYRNFQGNKEFFHLRPQPKGILPLALNTLVRHHTYTSIRNCNFRILRRLCNHNTLRNLMPSHLQLANRDKYKRMGAVLSLCNPGNLPIQDKEA